ncbi:MAG: hypothetical protein GY906_23255 [bacterium]|nr:hypothetical protein [bacterium]
MALDAADLQRINLRVAQPITTARDFERPDEPSWTDSVRASWQLTSSISAVARAHEFHSASFPVDPRFNPGSFLRDNTSSNLDIIELINTGNEGERDLLALAQSAEELRFNADAIARNRKISNEAFANGIPAGLLGIGLGLIDPSLLVGGAALRTVPAVARGARGARATAAARGAVAGAAEGLAIETTQGLADPARPASNLALGALVAGGLGAGLGALAPRLLLPKTANVDDLDVVFDIPAENITGALDEVINDSVGAARVAATPDSIKKGGSVVGLVSPKSRFIARARVEDYQEAASVRAVGVDTSVTTRLVNVEQATRLESAGFTRRQMSVEATIDDQMTNVAAVELEGARLWKDMRADLFPNVREGYQPRRLLGFLPAPRITRQEFLRMADELAISQSQGRPYTVSSDLNLTPLQASRLQEHLGKASKLVDNYYVQYGKALKAAGVRGFEDIDIEKGWRPQRWDTQQILDNREEFRGFLLEVVSKRPDDGWLTREGFVKPGQTFVDLPDGALKEQALDDWAALARRTNQATKEETIDSLNVSLNTALEEISSGRKFNKKLGQIRKQLKDAQRRTATAKTPKARSAADDEVARLSQLMNGLGRAISGEIDAVPVFRRVGLAAQAARVQRIQNKQALLEQQIEGLERSMVPSEVVDRMIDNLTSTKAMETGIMGFIDDPRLTRSGFSRRRSINLGENRFDDRARKFLRTDTLEVMRAQATALTPELGFMRNFGTNDAGDIVAQGRRAYEDAIRLSKGPDKDRLTKALRQYEKDTPKLIAELQRRNSLPEDPTGVAHFLARNLRNFNVSTMLGGVLLSSFADVAIADFATGTAGTVFRQFGKNNLRWLKRVQASDPQLAALIQGYEQVFANWRTMRIADVDDYNNFVSGFGNPGSLTRTVSSGITSANEAMATQLMRFSGLQFWNRMVRTMGMRGFALEVAKKVRTFDTLDPKTRELFARRGIDSDMAKRIDALYRNPKATQMIDEVPLPRQEIWSQLDEEALRSWRQAMSAAGEEMVISPGVGDRPNLYTFSGEFGRLLGQFQGFAFGALQKFLKPVMQRRDFMSAYASMLGMGMGVMVANAKMAVRGDFERAENMWRDNPEQMLYEGFIRSPLATGPTPVVTEFLLKSLGPTINEAAGRDVLPSTSRFFEQSAPEVFFGPSVATLKRLSSAFTESARVGAGVGDPERAARSIVRATPFANLFYLNSALRAAGTPGFSPLK